MYITTANSEVTENNIRSWIEAFERGEKQRLLKLDDYYNGKDNINKLPTELDKSTKRTINNIHVNYARMIVNNACGYFIGKPVTYAFSDKSFEDLAREIFWRNDEQAENIRLAKSASRFGIAYELMALDEQKRIYIKELSPLNTFYVVDDTILHNKICAITYWTVELSNQQCKTIGYVYTKDYILRFEGKNGSILFRESEINPFKPCIPVFEFWNNDECTGDYESVTELLSAYSKLISANFDDVDSIANAILAFINGRLNSEDSKEFKKSRIVQIIGENADIKYLEKHLDKEFVQYLREAIRDDIFSITHIPDLTDKNFSGVQSGEALSYKLIGFEDLRLVKQDFFEKGLFQRLTCLKNYKNLSSTELEIPEGEVSVTFFANLPSNIEKDKQIADLYNAGVLSLKTTLEKLEIVDDPDEELKRIQEEQPSVEDVVLMEHTHNDGEENGEENGQ